GAVGLDEHVHGDLPRDAAVPGDLADVVDHLGHLAGRRGLGDGQEGAAVAGAADHDVHVLAPGRVGGVVDAHAGHAVLVDRGALQVHDHLRVLALAAGLGPVIAVHGDVEDRA